MRRRSFLLAAAAPAPLRTAALSLAQAPWLRTVGLVAPLLLAACAQPLRPDPAEGLPGGLLADEAYGGPAEPIDAGAALRLSEAMVHYLAQGITPTLRRLGPRDGLIAALYQTGELRLEYEGSRTRTAAEAFEARAGNCLSLVLMTSALARHLGLPVNYHLVSVETSWARQGELVLGSAHVNLSLGRRPGSMRVMADAQALLTVDFLPQIDLLRQRARDIDEATVLAMYLNNRAAETLAQDPAGALDQAHAWAAAALRQSPAYLPALNTLAVIHRRKGLPQAAEAAWRHALRLDAGHAASLSNLAQLLQAQGRADEAAVLQQRLARVEPEPPYADFLRGREAYARGDLHAARRHFQREAERLPEDHELHYWLAVVEAALGDLRGAQAELDLAARHSPDAARRLRYVAKLDRLKANHGTP